MQLTCQQQILKIWLAQSRVRPAMMQICACAGARRLPQQLARLGRPPLQRARFLTRPGRSLIPGSLNIQSCLQAVRHANCSNTLSMRHSLPFTHYPLLAFGGLQ